MHAEVSGGFLDYAIFICIYKTDESDFYSWKVFSLEVGDICKLQGGKAHYDYNYCYNLLFFFLWDIWSTVENYF